MVYLTWLLKLTKKSLTFSILLGVFGHFAYSKDMGVCFLKAQKKTYLQHKINQVAVSVQEKEQIQSRVRYFNDLRDLWVPVNTYNYKLFWIKEPDPYWVTENCFKYGYITERDYGRRAITRVFSTPSVLLGEREVSNTEVSSQKNIEEDRNVRFGSKPSSNDSQSKEEETHENNQRRDEPSDSESSDSSNQGVLIYDSQTRKPTPETSEKLSYESQNPMAKTSESSKGSSHYNHPVRKKNPNLSQDPHSQSSSQDVLNREPAPQVPPLGVPASNGASQYQVPPPSRKPNYGNRDSHLGPQASDNAAQEPNLPASRFIHDGVLNQPHHSNANLGYKKYQTWPRHYNNHGNIDPRPLANGYNSQNPYQNFPNVHNNNLSHRRSSYHGSKSHSKYYRKVEHVNSPRNNLSRVQTQSYSAPPSYISPRITPRIAPHIAPHIAPQITPQITLNNNYYSGKRTMKNISRSGAGSGLKTNIDGSKEEIVTFDDGERESDEESDYRNNDWNNDWNNDEYDRSERRQERTYDRRYRRSERYESEDDREEDREDDREEDEYRQKVDRDKKRKRQGREREGRRDKRDKRGKYKDEKISKEQKKWNKKLKRQSEKNKELSRRLKKLRRKKEKAKKRKAKYEVQDYYMDPAIFLNLDPFIGYETVKVNNADVTNKFDLFSYGAAAKLGYRFNQYFNMYARGRYSQFHGISETDNTTLDLIKDEEYRQDYNYGGGFEHVASRFLSLAVEYNVFVMHSFESSESNTSRINTVEKEFQSVNLAFVFNLISRDNYRLGFSNNVGLGISDDFSNYQISSHFFIRRIFKRGYYGMHFGFERTSFQTEDESEDASENEVTRDQPVFSLNYGFDFF